MADWREENEAYMTELAGQEGYEKWPGGVFGKYITRAEVAADARKPRFDSVVTCHYTGRLINGKQFDTSHKMGSPEKQDASNGESESTSRLDDSRAVSPCDLVAERDVPAAFRVRELISGFQVGLTHMHVGDKIEVYIPWMQGYGARGAGRDIPPYSTLIFEIELLGIA